MKSKLYLSLVLLALAFAPLRFAYSQIEGTPHKVDYQGHLLASGGGNLSPGQATNFTIEFRIWDMQTGGSNPPNVKWAEQQVVTVSDGDFSVRLGEGAVIGSEPHPELNTVFTQAERYLGITVKVLNQTNGEIVPRLAFLASPYSLATERAKTADSVSQTAGTSMLGTTTITTLTVSGPVSVDGSNYMQFGNGVANKNGDAGKIGYQLFSPDSLDIVGAGTSGSNRKINFVAEGGANFTGAVSAPSFNGGSFTGTSFSGNGSNLTSLQGSNLNTGTVDVTKLVAAVQNALCPTGTIVAYAGSTAPAGWLMCDGTVYLNSQYQNLSNLIGSRFGTTSAGQNFRVPDFRGRFLRGRDGLAGNDPDAGTRVFSNIGGATGDNVGSLQADDFKKHNHNNGNYNQLLQIDGNYTVNSADFDNGFTEPNLHAPAPMKDAPLVGGNETRPKNISVNYIIKF